MGKKFKKICKDWRVKVAIQNIISLLPKSIGFKINKIFVEIAIGDINQRIDYHKRILKGLRNIEILYRELNFSLSGKTVLELGTGWHGIDLLIFYLLGANKIITIDHYAHLRIDVCLNAIKHFQNSEYLNLLLKLKYSENRMTQLMEISKRTINLNIKFFLELMRIQYLIVSASEYKKLPIKKNYSIDLFYSESVLQRIPVKYLSDIMQMVGCSCMKNNAVAFHRTDQKDINAQAHVDTNLWALEYLKYSDFIFELFISGYLNYQNRLRESDFLCLLQESGVQIAYLKSFCNKKDMERLKNFPLAKKFRNKNIEDLAIKQSIIVGKKEARQINMKREMVYL